MTSAFGLVSRHRLCFAYIVVSQCRDPMWCGFDTRVCILYRSFCLTVSDFVIARVLIHTALTFAVVLALFCTRSLFVAAVVLPLLFLLRCSHGSLLSRFVV